MFQEKLIHINTCTEIRTWSWPTVKLEFVEYDDEFYQKKKDYDDETLE